MTIAIRNTVRAAKADSKERRIGAKASRRIAAVMLLALGAPPAYALTQVSSFGSNPGALQMFKHVPSSMPSNAALVVALHGCTQTAAAYEATGWTALANTHKFYVVYPQQTSGNNQNKCFNWFEPGDIARGYGEALSIKQMVDNMKANHSIDPNKVFVTGLSAGGFMTTVMAATYPDVFRGAAPIAGGPYKCATTMTDAFSCMSPGFNKTPTQWGDLARSGYSGYSGTKPKISIWHGDADYTVKVMNLTETMEQFTNYHGIDQTADASATIKGYPRKRYNNGSGVTLVETYTITGMGHGTPVDPGTASDQCGTAGAYILDVNICSSYFIAQFFGIIGSGGGGGTSDTTAPTVSITAPANGATVSGTVTISASASDNVGVTKVEFYVDGALMATDTTAAYSYGWNSTTVANGSHTLMAKAYDAAGNTKTASISVNVSNSTSGVTSKSFSNIDAEDGYVKAYSSGSGAAVGGYANLALGRGSDGKFNRAVLSFDTSSIPDGATVTKAYLTVSRSSGSGDPWASPTGNQLVVDVMKGCFGGCTIATTDWAAAPTASAVASIAKFTSGSKNSTNFNSAGLAAINKTGRTQIKLRFTGNQSSTAYLFIYGGTSPKLVVEYQ